MKVGGVGSLKHNSILWQVDGNPYGDSNPSYLLGSIHFLDNDLRAFCFSLKEIIQTCDTLLVETNIDQLNPSNLNNYIFLPEYLNLEQLMGDAVVEKMSNQVLRVLDIDIRGFSRFRPFYILMLLTQSILPKHLNGSMDEHIWQMGFEYGLERRGAESLEQHLSVFDKIALETQAMMLKDFCKNLNKSKQQFEKLLRYYKQQNIQYLYRTSKKQLSKAKYELLYHRNKVMFETFHQNKKMNKSTFMAVGAAHLWGKFGILAELKRAGYKLKAIPVNFANN